MPTASKETASSDECIRTITRLLQNVGMPLPAARVYAYLLLQTAPAGIEIIAAGIGTSKASAWSGIHYLHRVGDVERFGEPGSKRALFASTGNYVNWLARNSRALFDISNCLYGASLDPIRQEASNHLKRRSDSLLSIHRIMENSLDSMNKDIK